MTRNVANEGMVKRAQDNEKLRRDNELSDLRSLLELPQGRRFLQRLLDRAKVFESIWEQNSRIYYNAGQQDFGHFIMGEIWEAKPDAYTQMIREAEARKLQGEINE